MGRDRNTTPGHKRKGAAGPLRLCAPVAQTTGATDGLACAAHAALAPAPGRLRRKRLGLRALFALWCVGALVSVSSLGAAHWYAFPAPAAGEPQLNRAVADARLHGEPRVLLHVLYAKCACSRRIFDHLRSRGALPKTAETIVLVDGDEALQRSLSDAGYRVVTARPEELETRFGVSAAPLLVIALTSDEPVYVGGYTARKQSLEIEDQRLLGLLESGVQPAFLPLFGCAVSERLQRMLDPLGLKFLASSVRTRS